MNARKRCLPSIARKNERTKMPRNWKIHTLTYPGELGPILQERRLGDAFRNFCSRERREDDLGFWNKDRRFRDDVASKIYFETYLAINRRYRIDVPKPVLDTARKLGQREDWTPRKWALIHLKAKREMERQVFPRLISEFYRLSDEFKEVHAAKLASEFKIDKQMMEKAGVSKANEKLLTQLVVAILTDGTNARTLASSLIKKEKSLKSTKPDELIRVVEKYVPKRLG